MAIRPVLLVPDTRLKQPCSAVTEFGDELLAVLQDLEDTRSASTGCVGIAAPQIGVLQQVAIVDTSGHKKHGAHSQGRIVLVNPTITARDGERVGREGCLSLPDFTANVKRSTWIEVRYQDEAGHERRLEAQEFEAVVIQHEIDHLNGILFLDRVANLATDVFPRKNK